MHVSLIETCYSQPDKDIERFSVRRKVNRPVWIRFESARKGSQTLSGVKRKKKQKNKQDQKVPDNDP